MTRLPPLSPIYHISSHSGENLYLHAKLFILLYIYIDEHTVAKDKPGMRIDGPTIFKLLQGEIESQWSNVVGLRPV